MLGSGRFVSLGAEENISIIVPGRFQLHFSLCFALLSMLEVKNSFVDRSLYIVVPYSQLQHLAEVVWRALNAGLQERLGTGLARIEPSSLAIRTTRNVIP